MQIGLANMIGWLSPGGEFYHPDNNGRYIHFPVAEEIVQDVLGYNLVGLILDAEKEEGLLYANSVPANFPERITNLLLDHGFLRVDINVINYHDYPTFQQLVALRKMIEMEPLPYFDGLDRDVIEAFIEDEMDNAT